MDCAIDPVTNKSVTADIASSTGYYICSYCRKRVGLRSGPLRKNYFAHWRGVSSSACAYFMSGSMSHGIHDKVQLPPTRHIDLRLLIKKGQNAGVWSLELVLPPAERVMPISSSMSAAGYKSSICAGWAQASESWPSPQRTTTRSCPSRAGRIHPSSQALSGRVRVYLLGAQPHSLP